MFESPPYIFVATVFGLAVLVGFLPARKYRTAIIGCIALGPLWFGLWLTFHDWTGIEHEFGTGLALLLFVPVFLAIWATITIWPFMLTVRLRKIHRNG